MSDADVFAAKSEEYAKRISKLQEEYLLPLKEDLSDWLKQIFVLEDLNSDNFMYKLDNGVIVCKLAKLIEENCNLDLGSKRMSSMRGCRTPKVSQALIFDDSIPEERNEQQLQQQQRLITTTTTTTTIAAAANNRKDQIQTKEKSSETASSTTTTTTRETTTTTATTTATLNGKQQSGSVDRKLLPQEPQAKWTTPRTAKPTSSAPFVSAKTMKCWENAKSESFYARDNVSNFIEWTRALGVRDAVTFETEDLVLHNNQRNVVLCLLEVARIACNRHSFSPAPGLVLLEKEIDEQIEKEASSELAAHLFLNEVNNATTQRTGYRTEMGQNACNGNGVASRDDDCDGWSSVQSNRLGRTPSVTSISSTSVGSSTETPAIYGTSEPSPLDHKVMLIAKSYYGRKAKHGIQRLAEGKYRIAGKIVFVRLLKDKHVMVRVGGGWDTLQHFLERHGGDALQADISPSDLLPMDTRPSESTSRRRFSQSSLQSTPATPTLRRCMSSTPVSRSTMSSPEPWMSGSSGYSSGGSGSKLRSMSRCDAGSDSNGHKSNGSLNSELARRRSNSRKEAELIKFGHRASVNIPITKSDSNEVQSQPIGVTKSTSSDKLPTSRNYHNYLKSSQHITNRTTTASLVAAANGTNGRIHSRNPIVRRSSLKAF